MKANPELKDLDALNWEKCKVLVLARASGEQGVPLSEITGEPAEVVHHIDGRTSPRKDWPDREDWPHSPLNCIVLTVAQHTWAHANTKASRVALWNRLFIIYGDLVWRGKTYRTWLEGPGPWRR